jgi:hypothetical protein
MSNIIEKAICLKLNKNWDPIGYDTIGSALIDLCAGKNSLAIDIQYEVDADGVPNFNKVVDMVPVKWAEWIELPVRDWDFIIHSQKLAIRAPTILIAMNYGKVPMRYFKGKPSADAIRIRDNNTCQYTGKKLNSSDLTLDHILPKSRGGKDTWENIVACDKEINFMKGNLTPEEAGLKLLKKPMVPKPVPVSSLIKEARHRDWHLFINKS